MRARRLTDHRWINPHKLRLLFSDSLRALIGDIMTTICYPHLDHGPAWRSRSSPWRLSSRVLRSTSTRMDETVTFLNPLCCAVTVYSPGNGDPQ